MRIIRVHENDLAILAEICYHLTSQGAAFTCDLRASYWEINITGV